MTASCGMKNVNAKLSGLVVWSFPYTEGSFLHIEKLHQSNGFHGTVLSFARFRVHAAQVKY